MKKNIFAAICIAFVLIAGFTACKQDNSTEVTYKGTVVNKLTAQPFPNLEVKVTDGEHINQTVHTDAMGMFSLLVRFNEINSKYYLLIGDSSCVPVKKEFKGFGQKEIDLGIIEVEGPTAPVVKTAKAANITAEGATLGGNVAEDGRATVTDRGICWSENQYPELNKDAHQSCGNGIGTFITTVTGLKHNTTYYFRAYATNRVGTSYGEQYQFTTTSGEAVVLTDSVFAITAVSAKCAATVVSDGGYQVTERGVCWSKTPDPTKTDFIATEGSGTGSYACALRNLDVNTEYYVRAFATNSVGTVYGEQYKILTLDGMAVVQLDSIRHITANSATAYARVTDDCNITVTKRGVCWSTNQYPTINDNLTETGRGLGNFISPLSKLEYGTTYYVRAFATNSTGTAYSEQLTFSTTNGLAQITTTSATNVTATTATCGGNVTDDGTLSVTARGVCYSTAQYPTTEDNHTNDGKGIGAFSNVLKNLNPNSTYYYRAYATTAAGTAYGEQKSFKTTDGMAKVTTAEATNITAVSATVGGNVTDDGTMTVTARGVCYSTIQYPTIEEDSHTTDGKGKGAFTSSINNLKDKTKYYYRAYATTAAGTAYGEQKTFTTADGSAAVTLGEVSNIKAASAIWTAEVTGNGGLSITERGICYSTSQYPTIDASHVATGSGMGAFTTTITSLSPNTQYYVRAYATNAVGTVYSEQKSFITLNGLPSVSTSAISSVTASSAQGGGEVTDDGGFTVSAYGLCWGKASNPTIDGEASVDGKGKAKFTHNITGLSANTTYYVRAYATNEIGTSYGENQTFTTTDGKATITTAKVTNITALTATCGGTVGETGGGTIKAVGVCWATTQNPTISNSHTTDGSRTGSFTSNLTGLTPNTKYYIRAYVTTNVTTTYGEQETFTTQSGLAELTTTTATSTSNTISSGGKITSDGGYAITARGICYSTSNSSPDLKDKFTTDGKGLGEYTSYVSGLSAYTTYYIRAYATNQIGTAYGNAITIKTKNGAASIKLGTVSNITALTASCSVTVSDAGGATLQSCGICWSTTQNPTITDNKTAGGNQLGTAYNCNMSALTPNTTYYVRGYATTDVTTTYSEQISFKTATGLPVLTTTEPTATSTTITTGGNITSDGGYTITARGICWSTTNSSPDINDKITNNGKGTGVYTSSITELTPNTTYYVRAYASNEIGTAYGSAITIKTKDGKAGITTTNITNITALTATGGGKVTDAGGATIKAVGICWATTQNPTIAGSHTTDGNSLGSFTSNLTGLKANTTYYVRAYCTTDVTTNYGDQVSFTTKNGAAAVTTEAVTNIKAFTATGGVTVTDAGGATLKSCGICWSSNPNPTIENNKSVGGNQLNTTYSLNITNLTQNTKYYVRAYATTDITTAYGKELSFITTKGTPEVTLAASTKVLTKSFVANANVTSDGGYSVTARGFCWSNSKGTPTISDSHVEAGTGMGAFAQTIPNLEANTTYYIRAYATNSMGTVYSDVSTQRTGNGLQGVYFDSNPISNIKAGSAVCKVSVDYKYSDVPIISEGVCWSSISSTPTINDAKTSDGQATISFTSTLTDLSPTTTYYVRAYITTSYGTTYSSTSVSFTTTDGRPSVTTNDITTANVTPSSFVCGGSVTDEGDAPVTARGICWNTTGTPTISDSHSNSGTGKGSFTHTITGVSTHTQTYYVRAYATNKYGTSYGEVVVQNKNNPYKLPTVTINNTTYMIYPTDLGEMTWDDASTACENLNAYGFDDWRLLTTDETKLFFPNEDARRLFTDGVTYWTSTKYNYTMHYVFKIDYGSGYKNIDWYPDSSQKNVRPIRIMIE